MVDAGWGIGGGMVGGGYGKGGGRMGKGWERVGEGCTNRLSTRRGPGDGRGMPQNPT